LKPQICEVGRALPRGQGVWHFPLRDCPARLSLSRPHLFAQVCIVAFGPAPPPRFYGSAVLQQRAYRPLLSEAEQMTESSLPECALPVTDDLTEQSLSAGFS